MEPSGVAVALQTLIRGEPVGDAELHRYGLCDHIGRFFFLVTTRQVPAHAFSGAVVDRDHQLLPTHGPARNFVTSDSEL